MTDTQRDLVLYFLKQNDWAQATAYYQEETGTDFETAQTAINRLAKRYGLVRSPNRIAYFILLAAGLLLWIWAMRA